MNTVNAMWNVQPLLPDDAHITQAQALYDAHFIDTWDLKVTLQNPHHIGLMVCDELKLLGYIIATLIQNEAEILTLSVDQEHQNKGIGRALIESLKRQAHTILLDVRISNEAALALYAQCGFRRVGFRPRYQRNQQGILEDSYTLKLQ